MSDSPPPSRAGGSERLALVLAVVAVAASVVGFFTGIDRSRGGAVRPPAPASASASIEAPAVPAYGSLGKERRGPNAGMYAGAVERLSAGLPDLFASVTPTAEARAEGVRGRAELRAYDGAPPRVPHAVRRSAAPDCLACHEKGARIGDRVAKIMSHPRMDSCPQCHVPVADARGLGPSSPPPDNAFDGLGSPGPGQRAWPGAPPTIPHRTSMRETCTSCHGGAGALGLRTPHPYRQSCTQCHAPNAALDQHAFRAEEPSP